MLVVLAGPASEPGCGGCVLPAGLPPVTAHRALLAGPPQVRSRERKWPPGEPPGGQTAQLPAGGSGTASRGAPREGASLSSTTCKRGSQASEPRGCFVTEEPLKVALALPTEIGGAGHGLATRASAGSSLPAGGRAADGTGSQEPEGLHQQL